MVLLLRVVPRLRVEALRVVACVLRFCARVPLRPAYALRVAAPYLLSLPPPWQSTPNGCQGEAGLAFKLSLVQLVCLLPHTSISYSILSFSHLFLSSPFSSSPSVPFSSLSLLLLLSLTTPPALVYPLHYPIATLSPPHLSPSLPISPHLSPSLPIPR